MQKYEKWLKDIDLWIAGHEADYIQDLSALVNIESVAVPAPGQHHVLGDGCAAALDKALELAESYGLRTENDEYYCGSALLPGREERELAMVGHLDVVPAGNGWHFEPFHATVRDGQLIGRGAVDNKGAVTAALYALRCLKELNVPLRHTLRVLMGCHEESGMTDMPHFLEKHGGKLPELFLVCDCAFPIHYGEKGIMRLMLEKRIESRDLLEFCGGVAPNSIPEDAYAVIAGRSAEEVRAALDGMPVNAVEPCENGVKVSATGISGHAASPETGTENAIAKLAAALTVGGVLSGDAADAVAFLDRILRDYYGSGLHIEYEDEMSGKNTLVGGMVRLKDGLMSQSLNIRCAITANMDEILENVQKCCEENGFGVKALAMDPPLYIPLDSMNGLPLKLAALANELLGMGELKPAVLPGGTHTRLLPHAIGYGPNLGPELEFKKHRFGSPHGADEAVIISDMMKAIRVYAATWIWLDEQKF